MFQLEEFDDFVPETKPVRQLVSHTGGIYKIVMHPTKKSIVASCSVDCTINIWNIGQEDQSKPKTAVGNYSAIMHLTKDGFDNPSNLNVLQVDISIF